MKRIIKNMPNNKEQIYLEPRVAKLEVGLDRLTEDVRSLVSVVRDQGTSMESEIQKLVVAVTVAQSPKKTDWSIFISVGFLILAIGSAVFWPLNQATENNKESIEKTKIYMEKYLNEKVNLMQVKEDGIQKYNNLFDTKMFGRIEKLEDEVRKYNDRNYDELTLWRQKAMGLSSPNESVPLVSKSISSPTDLYDFTQKRKSSK